MTDEQHTIAELQELVERLRDKLADAESCCAAQKEWIDATFENCSVFSDPPKCDAGKDYVPKSEADKLWEEIAGLRGGFKIALKNWQWDKQCLKDAVDKGEAAAKRLRLAVTESITHFGIIANFDGDDPDCPFEDPGQCARAALSKIKSALKEGQ